MEFLDKLSKKASETYKHTTEKTSKIAKEAKLKMQMNENKSKIEEVYEEIGKKVYEHHISDMKVDIDLEAILEEYCIQIDALCDVIEDERKELLILKDKKQCPECFCEIEADYNYCPSCGIKQVDVTEEDIKDEKSTLEESIKRVEDNK